MPEIKNTFLKSKMNKDLDSRIIPNGEYRDGQNVSISASEGADVGALENIRGNISVANFGLNEPDLEIIGYHTDTANDRIFLFITNNNDNSSSLPKITNSGSNSISSLVTINKNPVSNYICCFALNSSAGISNTGIIVSGSFLNFSKNNPINNSNLIEGLLFWTDDRNQPRKINIKRALGQPFIDENNKGYYHTEDQISVAKYAPFDSISFLKKLDKQDSNYAEPTLKNEVDEFLPPFIAVPCIVKKADFAPELGRNYLEPNKTKVYQDMDNTQYSDLKNFLTDGSGNGNFNFNFHNTDGTVNNSGFKVKVSIYGESGFQDAFIDYVSVNGNIYLQTSNGEKIQSFGINSNINWDLDENNKINIAFSLRNPDYNENFSEVGDEDLLKEKFVRFSYRFKYDDDEYSLTAPFSQHAFVPKQFGYFIGEDAEKAKESSVVNFMVNQITTAGLVIKLPCRVNEMYDKLKVKELQILYKASDEQALKVVTDIDLINQNSIKAIPDEIEIDNDRTPSNQTGYTLNQIYTTFGGSGSGLTVKVTGVDLSGGGSTGPATEVEIAYSGYGYKLDESIGVGNGDGVTNDIFVKITNLSDTYIHDYNSQKPIKVLPEKEIVRVSDIVPIKAKTQESVGNRVIYGNFQQSTESLNSLKYNVTFEGKTSVSTQNNPTFLTGIELNNHTLKQGRSYQVGIVLQDRYGRSSNVILADDTGDYNSTFFARYMNGGSDPLSWLGNSINITFDEKIPTEQNGDYAGVWSELNPMGWYSYKVVVKQQEQDYYNIYTPGAVSGNIKFTKWGEELSYLNTKSISSITVFNDNINKIPRDLKETAATDNIYSSSVELINRVNQTSQIIDGIPDLNGQALFPYENSDIITLRPFRELGDWTIYKGVNLQFTTIGPAAVDVNNGTVSSGANPYPSPTYIYPGNNGEVDPFFLDNNKNPIISTISTSKRIGLSESDQESFKFAKELTIFETKPIKSSLDIYYETSTSGTIEDLNFSIQNIASATGDTVGISPISLFSLPETDQFNQNPISNQFQCIDVNNNFATDPSCRIRLDKVEYEIDGNGVFSTMDDNPNSSGVPSYLASKGFLSGSFNSRDISNPFKLVEALPATSNTPPIYQLVLKRPLNMISSGEVKYRFHFTATQSPNISIAINPVDAIFTDLKPKIAVIGLPTRNGSYTNQTTLPNRYQPATHVYKDWNTNLIMKKTWNHYDLDENNNLTKSWSGTYPNSQFACAAPSWAATYPNGTTQNASYGYEFRDLNAASWYGPLPYPFNNNYNKNTGSQRVFRRKNNGTYWCEMTYSTNGIKVLNSPDWASRTTGSNSIVSSYAIDPDSVETDWSIRNFNRYQQTSGVLLVNQSKITNILKLQNTRLDSLSSGFQSSGNNIRKNNGGASQARGLEYKVVRAYYQICTEFKNIYVRDIGYPVVITNVEGTFPGFGSGGFEFIPGGPTGIKLSNFGFEYFEGAYDDGNGGAIDACKGYVEFSSLNYLRVLLRAFNKNIMFTVYIVAIDNKTGLQSDPYVAKFNLHK